MIDERCVAGTVCVLAAWFCTACGPELGEGDVEKPPAPDTSELTAAYDSPTGSFDEKSAASAIAAAQSNILTLVTLDVDQLLVDLVNSTATAQVQTDAEGTGYMLATRICAGWTPGTVNEKQNGRLELIVPFSKGAYDPVMWGQAISCRYLSPEEVLLRGPSGRPAGDVMLDFGEAVPFVDVARHRVLVDLDTGAQVDGKAAAADLDFRYDPASATLELRVPGTDGDVIVITQNGALRGVRADNGDFTCNEASRSCAAGAETVAF